MVERFVNYSNGIGMNENLEDILNDVGDDDELIITMEGEGQERANYLADILEEKGFEVLPKGGHDNGEYHLVARKRKKH